MEKRLIAVVLLMIGIISSGLWRRNDTDLLEVNMSTGAVGDSNWTIEGDTIYYEDLNRGIISQTPHTSNDFTNKPTINFTSYFATEQCLDFAFGFDSEQARASSVDLYNPRYVNDTKSYTCDYANTTFNYTLNPKHAWCWQDRNTYNCADEFNCTINGTETVLIFERDFEVGNISTKTIYWNVSRFIEWDDISEYFGQTTYNGNNYYYVTNVTFQPNETKSIRPTINVKPQIGENYGKYDVLIKRCQDTIAEAFASGNYVELDPWWNTTFQNTRKITFSDWTGPLTENLTDFPYMVILNSTYIDYAKTLNDGTDLRFIDADNSTELSYHIEKWNESGDSFVWVKVPLLDNSSTDHIWMYHNFAGAGDVQDESGTYDNDYVMVNHLHAFNSTNGTLDSTQYNNDGVGQGFDTDPAVTVTSGQIDNATEFDGVNDYIDTNSLFNPTNAQSIAVWVKTETFDSIQTLAGGGDVGFDGWIIRQRGDQAGDFIEYGHFGENATVKSANNPLISGQWAYVVAVWNGTNTIIYVNGSLSGSAQEGGYVVTDDNLYIGARNNDGVTQHYWNGTIDEVRISNVSRSSAHINLSYLSQVGVPHTVGPEASVTDGFPYFHTNTTNSTLAGNATNFTITMVDDSSLSFYLFETNNSGTFINSSWIATSGTTNIGWNVTTLNTTVGVVLQYRFFANDSSNNVNVSQIYELNTTTSVDTCTVPGSGDWEVICADNCSKADEEIDLSGDLRIIGPDFGYFITSNVNITMNDFKFNATNCIITTKPPFEWVKRG